MTESKKVSLREMKMNIIKTIRSKGLYNSACEEFGVAALSSVSIESLRKFLKDSYRDGFRSASYSRYDEAFDY